MATRISNTGWPEIESGSSVSSYDWFDDDIIPSGYDPGRHTFLFGAGFPFEKVDDYVRKYKRLDSVQFLKSMIRRIELSFKEVCFRPDEEFLEENNYSHHMFIPFRHVTVDFVKNTFIRMLTASYIRLNELTNNESRRVVERNVADRIEMMKAQVIKRASVKCESGTCEAHASCDDADQDFPPGIVGNRYNWFPDEIIPASFEPSKHCFLFEVDADLDYFMSLYQDIKSIPFLQSMISAIEKAYKKICLCPDSEKLCDIDNFGYINICAHRIKDAFADMLVAINYQLNALILQKQPKNKVVKKVKNHIKMLSAEAAKEKQTKLNETNDLNDKNSGTPIKISKKKKKKTINSNIESDNRPSSSSTASLPQPLLDLTGEKYQSSLEKFTESLKSSVQEIAEDRENLACDPTLKNLACDTNTVGTNNKKKKKKKKSNTTNNNTERDDSSSSNNLPSLSESHQSLTKEKCLSNLKENVGLLHKSAVEEIVEGIMSTLRNKALASLSELSQQSNKVDTSAKNKTPIFFYTNGETINSCMVMREINSFTAHETYGTSCSKGIRLNPLSNSDYELIIKFLSDKGIPYHTYTKKEDLPRQFVFRGIPSFVQEEEILKELEKLGYSPIKVILLKKKNHIPMPLMLVILPSCKESNNILKVTNFLGFKIKVERKHKKKRKMPIMCFKCQEIGHTSYKCFRDDVCVRCGENHRSADCKRPVNEEATCVHCKMNHTANFKGCSYYQNFLKKYTEQRKKPVVVDVTESPWGINYSDESGSSIAF